MNKTILIILLLSSLAFATTINLNYSECQDFIGFNDTDNSTYNFSVCSPAYPSHVDMLLGWGQNASANNVTATCEAWRDTNLTICPSPPPITSLDLVWGQSATMNNFTANCQSWHDTNITICPDCAILPQVSYNLTFSEVKTFNNFTASCTPWVDLNITEPQIVYFGCPQLNKTVDLYPEGVYSNFTYGLVVHCLQSISQPTVVYVQQALTPQIVSLNCNATEARALSDRNLTLSIQQCPVCPTCNVSELCPPRPDDQILNCSVKACFCQSELADFVSMDAFAQGNARVAFNASKNAYIARASLAENKSADDNRLRLEAVDKYDNLKGSNDDNNKILVAVCIVLGVAVLVNYLKSRDVKSATSPKDMV